jgi:hypothetical protein
LIINTSTDKKNIMKKIHGSLMLVAGLAFVASCTKADYSDDFSTSTPPPIGNYNNSDEVASASLAAKWSFDGGLTESKQNLAGTATGTGFMQGQKAQALQGTANGYVVYSNAGTLANLKSFTVSFWMKPSQQFAGGATQVFQIENTGDFWSNMTVYFEPPAGDSSRFRMQFHKEGVTWNNAFIEAKLPDAGTLTSKWTHIVATYDGGTSTYRVYQNSVKYFETQPQAGPTGPGLGDLNFINPGRVIFGTWKQKIGAAGDSWMINYQGGLDEFRIYNKALTDQEISALFRLEKRGT